MTYTLKEEEIYEKNKNSGANSHGDSCCTDGYPGNYFIFCW